jgi:Arm DNA-binding domain
MCQKSRTGGVMPKGPGPIQFDLRINGRRIRPSLPWAATEKNLRRAREHIKALKASR